MITSSPRPRLIGASTVRRPLIVFLVATAAAAPVLAAVQTALVWTTTGWQLTQFATVVGVLAAAFVGPWPLPGPLVQRRRLAVACTAAVGWGTTLAIGTVALADLVDVPAGAGAGTVRDAVSWSAALVIGTVAGALGEEIGWRGLAQPLLETRWRWWTAAVVVGVLFGAGHVHLLAAGPIVYALFVGSAVGLSILAAGLGRGRSRWQRVLLGTVLHAVVNLGLLVVGTGHDLSSVAGASVLAAATSTTAVLFAMTVAVSRRRDSDRSAQRSGDPGVDQRRERSSTTT